jgi:hypothetical protein
MKAVSVPSLPTQSETLLFDNSGVPDTLVLERRIQFRNTDWPQYTIQQMTLPPIQRQPTTQSTVGSYGRTFTLLPS